MPRRLFKKLDKKIKDSLIFKVISYLIAIPIETVIICLFGLPLSSVLFLILSELSLPTYVGHWSVMVAILYVCGIPLIVLWVRMDVKSLKEAFGQLILLSLIVNFVKKFLNTSP